MQPIDPLFEISSVDFKGKELAIKKIDETYKAYIAIAETRDKKAMEAFYHHSFYKKVDDLRQIALHYSIKDLDSMPLSDLIHVCQMTSVLSKQDLTNLSSEDLWRKYNADSFIIVDTKDTQLKNLTFTSERQALAIVSSGFMMSSIIFELENGEWKLNTWGSDIFKRKKEEALLKSGGLTREKIIKQYCSNLK